MITLLSIVLLSPKLFAETKQASQANREPLTIVITGSNLPVKKTENTSATIVDRQTIDKINPRTISQLLNLLPGLYIENTVSRGSINALYLRGAEPNYTAVLVNGVKVNDPTNSRGGAFDFSQLDIHAVERIEIVKGPVSSLYGSEAMAGVVNIITRQPAAKSSASIRIEGGSKDFFNASATAGKAFASGNLSVRVLHADDGQQVEGSSYIADTLNLGGDYETDNKIKLSANLSLHESESQSYPGASGGPEYAVIQDVDQQDTSQTNSYISVQRDINVIQSVKLQLNYYRSKENINAVGIDSEIPPNTNNSEYQRHTLSGVYTLKTQTDLDASIGAEVEQENGTSSGIIDPGGMNIPTNFNLERNIAAVFAELRYQLSNQWRLYAGLRIDAPEDVDNQTSPRLGLEFTHLNTTYRLDWGEGFKLPGFYALAHPIVGNPEFVPETSESIQLAINHQFSATSQWSLAGFLNRYFDLIDFDSNSNTLVQRSEVEIKGIEVTIKHWFSQNLLMQFQYTALDMDVVNSDQVLLKRPDRFGAINFNWRIDKAINLSLSANYTGEVKDFSFPTGQQSLDSYTLVNLSLDASLDKNWRFQVALDNLLNDDYQEAIGFTSPGVGVRLSVNANF